MTTLTLKKNAPADVPLLRSDMPLPFDSNDLHALNVEVERQCTDIELEIDLCDPEKHIGRIARLQHKYKHLKVLRMRVRHELADCHKSQWEVKKLKFLTEELRKHLSLEQIRTAEVLARLHYKSWKKNMIEQKKERRANEPQVEQS